jgi:hypothetical protein
MGNMKRIRSSDASIGLSQPYSSGSVEARLVRMSDRSNPRSLALTISSARSPLGTPTERRLRAG